MLAICGIYSEHNFGTKLCVEKMAIWNHFVALWKVCYWEETICKHRVEPSKFLPSNGFVVNTLYKVYHSRWMNFLCIKVLGNIGHWLKNDSLVAPRGRYEEKNKEVNKAATFYRNNSFSLLMKIKKKLLCETLHDNGYSITTLTRWGGYLLRWLKKGHFCPQFVL